MKILLTNDDGIHARGLRALAQRLGEEHHVVVVAPLHEKSGVGCQLTLTESLEVTDHRVEGAARAMAVTGSPVDCVKLALAELLSETPDAVISGINLGANLGANVFYSGTVAAAIEAALQGIPAMATSLGTFDASADYASAVDHSLGLVTYLRQIGLPPGYFLNVNVPARPRQEILGIKVTIHGPSRFSESYVPDEARTAFRLGEGILEKVGSGANDAAALEQGYVSVTPMRVTLTAPLIAGAIQAWLPSKWRNIR